MNGLTYIRHIAICLISLLFTAFSLIFPAMAFSQTPVAEKGIIDLRQWDFKKDGIVGLNGQWEFFWRKFVEPGAAHGDADYIHVPATWNQQMNGFTVSGKGWGTYRLILLMNDNDSTFALKIPEAGTAYALFINSIKYMEVGKVGTDATHSTPRYEPVIIQFKPDQKRTELVLWVSNHHHKDGGLWYELNLGLMDQILEHKFKKTAFDLFLFGSILVMGIYHLLLFNVRREERYAFFFSVFCILVSIRILVTGERYILNIVSSFSWNYMIKIEYITFYLGGGAFLAFCRYLFPKEINTYIYNIVQTIVILFSLSVILLPPSIFTQTLTYAQIIVIAMVIYMCWVMIVSIKNKRMGAGTLFLAYIIFFSTVLNDILYTIGKIDTMYMFHMGVFFFVIAQAYIIAKKFSSAFHTIKQQREEIDQKHKSLSLELLEKQKAETALRNSEKRFRNLAELLPGAVFEADMNGKLLFSNKTASAFFIFYPVSSPGTNFIWEAFSPSSKQTFSAKFKIATRRRTMVELEVMGKRLDGTEFPAMVFMNQIIDDNNNCIGVRGIVIDITLRKELERRLRSAEKMESIGTLSGGIAHEFNNILGIIIANAELAMMDLPELNSAYNNLREIMDASLRGRDIVLQLLRFSRNTEDEKEPIDIVPIVKTSLKLLRASIPWNITFKQAVPDAFHIINANATQLNQIIINLCNNAADAMSENGGILEISLENVTLADEDNAIDEDMAGGDYIKLTVTDSGHGIPKEYIHRIFDPFFTTKDIDKGTGMGLSIVHGIVKSHGASIRVHSIPGEKTSFYVFFPLVGSHMLKIHDSPKKQLPGGTETILFVDDEEQIAKSIFERLNRLGYSLEIFTNPKDALKRFISKPSHFDLIITDMAMPHIMGDKLIREIRNIQQEIPIILTTGYSDKLDKKRALEIGANAFIMKPIDTENLAHLIQKVLHENKD